MRYRANLELALKNPRALVYKLRDRLGRMFLSGPARYASMQIVFTAVRPGAEK